MDPSAGTNGSPEVDVRGRLPSLIEEAFFEGMEGVGEDSRFCRVERILMWVAMWDSAFA